MLTAGTIGFGGGSALIPVIEKEVVAKRHFLTEEEYTRHTVVANVTPGALPVKLAAFVGQHQGGGLLAIAAALAMAAPGTLAMLGLIAASEALGPNAIQAVKYASVGITAFIIVLLVGYILKVHRTAGHRLPIFIAITVISALLNGSGPIIRVVAQLVGRPTEIHPPHMSAVQVIVLSLAVIVGYTLVRSALAARRGVARQRAGSRGRTGPFWRAAGAFGILAALGAAAFVLLAGGVGAEVSGLLALSTVTSFGGGEAYIGVAEGFFVRSGLVDQNEFFTQLVPIANALPGPILVKVAAGVGYFFGLEISPAAAWALGLAGMALTVAASCAVALPVLGAYESLQHHPLMINIGTYILPVICGLLIQVSASMLEVSGQVAESAGVSPVLVLWLSVVAIGGLSVVHIKKLIPDIFVLLACGAISLIALW